MALELKFVKSRGYETYNSTGGGKEHKRKAEMDVE